MPAGGDIFTPIAVERISGRIVERVRLAIRQGRLAPGDRLPSERELGDRFGVSRVSVREALRVLEAGGLVEIRVGARGGAFVTAPSSQRVGASIADLLSLFAVPAAEAAEACRVLEVAIMPMVCDRATDEDIAGLEEIVTRSRRALDEGRSPVELCTEFHLRVARAAHNAALEMLVRSVHGPPPLSPPSHPERGPDVGELGVREHEAVADAVRDRDGDRAQQIMCAHLGRGARRDQRPGRPDREALAATRRGGRR